MKAAFFLAMGCAAAFGQSNAIQLCDQQATRHCLTLKAPATLPANVVCTTGTTDLGSCSGATPAYGTITFSTPGTLNASGSGGALNVLGSSTTNGNIVLSPGAVAANASVTIQTPRTDQPGLILNNAAGTTTGNVLEIRDSASAIKFKVIGSGDVNAPNYLVTAHHVGLAGNTYDLGASTNRWRKLWVQDIDASGGILGSTTSDIGGTSGYFRHGYFSGTVEGTRLRTYAGTPGSMTDYFDTEVGGSNIFRIKNSSSAVILEYQNVTTPLFQFSGRMLPDTNNSRDLGSSTLGWRDLYLTEYGYMGGSIFINSSRDLLNLGEIYVGGNSVGFRVVDASRNGTFANLTFSGTLSGTIPACATCLTTAGGQTVFASDTFAAGLALTGGGINAGGLGGALVITGASTGNGNIVLNPGAVAANASVTIQTPRVDQPGLILNNAAGTTTGNVFEIRDSASAIKFKVIGSGDINAPNYLVTAHHVGLSGNTYDLGASTNRWRKLWAQDIDASGGILGSTTSDLGGASGYFRHGYFSGTVEGTRLRTFAGTPGSMTDYFDTEVGGSNIFRIKNSSDLVILEYQNVTTPVFSFSGRMLPDTNNSRDLGSSTLGWRDLYLTEYGYMGGSIFINSSRDLLNLGEIYVGGNSAGVRVVDASRNGSFANLTFSGTISGSLVTSLVAGSGISISSSTGAVTVTATGGGSSGSVTSVATAGPITGGPITTTGTIGCASCLTTSGGQTISGSDTFAGGLALTGGGIYAGGLGGALVITGASGGNGNIVLNPGAVAANASVTIQTPRTDQPGLILNNVAGTTTGNVFEIRDSASAIKFKVIGSGDINAPNYVVTAHHVGLAGNTYDLGASTNRWRKLWVTDVDFSGTISGTVPACATCLTTAGGQTISGSDTFAGGVAITGGGVGLDIQVAAAVQYLTSTTTTNRVYQRYNNGAGNLYVGIESSLGSSLLFGAPAYAAIVGIDTGRSLVFGTSNVGRLEIDAGGLVTAKNGVAITGGSVALDIQVAAAVQYLTSTTTTNRVYQRYNNGAGNLYVGIESSGGSSLLSGAPGYAAIVGIDTGHSLVFGTSNTVRLEIDSSGNTLPSANNAYALGGSGRRWSKLWAQDIDFSGTISGTLPVCTTCLTTAGGQTIFGSDTFAAGFAITGGNINASSLGTALSIFGSASGNGNIVLNPGNVAANASVTIQTPRTDQPGLIVNNAAGTTTGNVFEIRDAGNQIKFKVIGSGDAFAANYMVTAHHVGLTGNTYNLGAPTNYWAGVYANTYFANGNTGTTQVVTVRNAANTGACVLIFSGGIFVGSSC